MTTHVGSLARPGALIPILRAVLLQIVLLGGCAGPKIHYGDAVARLDASGAGRVAVTAYDQRNLVTSGRENPTYVGRQRSLYHIAIVSTASGRPLGDDLTSVLAKSLAAKGFKTIPVVVSHSETPGAVAQRMALMQVDRGVVLTVADWRTDTRVENYRTQLFWDLDLKILDASGQALAQRRLAGHEDPMSGAAPDAFRQKLELLMNYPEITQALALRESSPTVEPPPLSAPRPLAPSPQPPAISPSPDVAAQLRKLKDLHEQGLITEDVYKEKMRQILNQL